MRAASIGRAVLGSAAALLVGLVLVAGLLVVQPGGGGRARQIALSLDRQHVLTLTYGRLCLPSLPQSACRSGIRRSAVQISYRTPAERRVLLFAPTGR